MKTIKIANIAKTAIFAVVAAALSLGLATGTAEAAGGTMYGDPAAAAQWWRHQNYDDCAIMASADVVGQVTGKEPTEDAIIKMAQSTPSTVHRRLDLHEAGQGQRNVGHGHLNGRPAGAAEAVRGTRGGKRQGVLAQDRRSRGHRGTRAAAGQRPQGDRFSQRRNDLAPAASRTRTRTATRALTTQWW